MLHQSNVILCPLEEVIFWNWSNFSEPIPTQIIDYFFYKIKDTLDVSASVKRWHPAKENIHIIGTLFWEYIPECFIHKIKQISDMLHNNGIQFTLLINNDYRYNFEKELANIADDVIFINYFMLRTYWYTVKDRNQLVNRNWNSSAEKGLFLTGKTNKIHRIGLLFKLYEQNKLLIDFVWSSFINNENIKDECFDIVKYMGANVETFEKFVNDINHSADDIDIITGPEQHTFYSGFPYIVQLYGNTKYSVISESYFSINRNGGNNDKIPFITEKTWKTVVNHHPYIMAGMPYTNKFLENMGFSTFDEFMTYPLYQEMEDKNIYNDPYTRIKRISDNIANFSEKLDENKDVVKQYTEHNYNHFNNLIIAELNVLMDFISTNNLELTINEILSLINDTFNDKNEYHVLQSK